MFLDYDGTLTPIVARPEQALLSASTRDAIGELARRCFVAVVTGRGLEDVRALVGLPELTYAGNHGFEIRGPDFAHEVDPALREVLGRAEQEVAALAGRLEGVRIEPKGYSISVHYRQAPEALVPALRAEVERLLRGYPALRMGTGKKVFELRPARDWHKGEAVRWICARLAARGEGEPVPLFIGDDVTDEDGLAAVRERGVGIFVGQPGWPSAARYGLPDPAAVEGFLRRLAAAYPPAGS